MAGRPCNVWKLDQLDFITEPQRYADNFRDLVKKKSLRDLKLHSPSELCDFRGPQKRFILIYLTFLDYSTAK